MPLPEYNCLLGQHRAAVSGGIAVYECGSSGYLAAARVYDDVQASVEGQ
jgi:hypothetical protein